MMNYPDVLVRTMSVLPAAVVLAFGLIYAAWQSDAATRQSRLASVAFGTVLGLAAIAYPLARFGFDNTVGTLHSLRLADPVFGWVLTLSYYAGFALPLITVVVSLSVLGMRRTT